MENNNLNELKIELRKLLVGIKPKFWIESAFRIKHSELFQKFENYNVVVIFKTVLIDGPDGNDGKFDCIEAYFKEL